MSCSPRGEAVSNVIYISDKAASTTSSVSGLQGSSKRTISGPLSRPLLPLRGTRMQRASYSSSREYHTFFLLHESRSKTLVSFAIEVFVCSEWVRIKFTVGSTVAVLLYDVTVFVIFLGIFQRWRENVNNFCNFFSNNSRRSYCVHV